MTTLNVLFQQPAKGALDKIGNTQTETVQIISTSTDSFTPGMPVQLANAAGKMITVSLAGPTDAIYGFVVYKTNKNTHAANDIIEIAPAGDNGVVYMEAGAAINRGFQVEYQVTDAKVITSAGTNKIIGTALDQATADGDLIRVKLNVNIINQV